VRDLGVVVDSHLCFSEHIANSASKAHQRANLIQRCFSSSNRVMFVKAFKVYVRPILEFNSPVWSPSLMKNILLIESVHRKFTKRIPGMSGWNYYSRLRMLGLESLDLRRLRTDVLLVYRILFGMVRLNSNEFFTLRNQPHLRSHKYVIQNQQCCNNRRNDFFSNWIVNLWNTLQPSTTDFTSFNKFDESLSNDYRYLLLYCTCTLNFT